MSILFPLFGSFLLVAACGYLAAKGFDPIDFLLGKQQWPLPKLRQRHEPGDDPGRA